MKLIYSCSLVLILISFTSQAIAPPSAIHLAHISHTHQGIQANDDSFHPVLSTNRRFVAFASKATNLVPDDTNNAIDIFVHDRQTGEISRVSVANDGSEGNYHSMEPDISANGRFVVFHSQAENLVATDNNGAVDVFVHDRQTGETLRASVDSEGSQVSGGSHQAAISANGDTVVFASNADHLVSNDHNQRTDIFAHQLSSGETTLVSIASDGTQSNTNSSSPDISADGLLITFVSEANNLVTGDTNQKADVFVHNRSNGETHRVSIASDGREGDDSSYQPFISANGQFIAFSSNASNLIPEDYENQVGIFVHDRHSAETRLFSIARDATQNAQLGRYGTLSANGDVVAYYVSGHKPAVSGPGSDHFQTVVHDAKNGQIMHRIAGQKPSLSPTGDLLVFSNHTVNADSNDRSDIFAMSVNNVTASAVAAPLTRISVDSNGIQANSRSHHPDMDSSGRFVVFSSKASNLVTADHNNHEDVFVHDRNTGQTTRVSVSSHGDESDADSLRPSISADGRFVVFDSIATTLVTGDVSIKRDIFIHDRQTGETREISVNSAGVRANGGSSSPDISADGRFVVFSSHATNLEGAVPPPQQIAVFIHDRQTGKTQAVSIDSQGKLWPGDFAAISGDGRFISFESNSEHLVDNDTNGKRDIFIHDRISRTTQRVSIANNGTQGDGHSTEASISDNGQFIVFLSRSTTLTPDILNRADFISANEKDIFVHDRQSGQTTRVPAQHPLTHLKTPRISEDGRLVIYASDLGVKVYDRQSGETKTVSISATGKIGSGRSAVISADGRSVAFISFENDLVSGDSDDLRDIFAGEIVAMTTPVITGMQPLTRLSRHIWPFGSPEALRERIIGQVFQQQTFIVEGENLSEQISMTLQDCSPPVLQSGGSAQRRVFQCIPLSVGDKSGVVSQGIAEYTFTFSSADPLPGATSGAIEDFILPLSGNNTGEMDAIHATLSADGRRVAFTSKANHLSSDDIDTDADVFVYDFESKAIKLVSKAIDEAKRSGRSEMAMISADGRYVTFTSRASNLVVGDNNRWQDVFIHDLETGETQLISMNSAGQQANLNSDAPTISADGRYVAFWSSANNLVADDNNQLWDVFVHDRQTGTTSRISVRGDGRESAGDRIRFGFTKEIRQLVPSISADGNLIAFRSAANLVNGGSTGRQEIYVHDRSRNQTRRVSVNSAGQAGNADSFSGSLSADGRFVAFESWASNLVEGDSNRAPDIFVHDRVSGNTELVSASANGEQGNDGSFAPTINSNGRYISFISNASNLLAGNDGHGMDVFVHDRDTGEMRSARVAQDGAVLPGFPALSDNGRWVAYDFVFKQLFAPLDDQQWPVLVVDLQVTTPIITDISPLNAAVDTRQNFIVTGSDLTDTISMTVQDCPDSELQPNGSSNQRIFSCTPTAIGSKSGTVNMGQTQHSFAIVVSDPALATEP